MKKVKKIEVRTEPVNAIYLSTYIPRRCGIASFAKDLTTAINLLNPQHPARIIAVNKSEDRYDYPWEVKYRIIHERPSDYKRVASLINNSTFQIVHIQHEFGIFGGDSGEFIVSFAEKLKKPIVTTLHTVSRRPSYQSKKIVQSLGKLSRALVVMSEVCIERLEKIYSVPKRKIVYIPHGAPDLSFNDSDPYKKRFGLKDKIVITAINLLSANKGLEYALKALPGVIRKHPNVVYLIIGVTHPEVLKWEGERYRKYLKHTIDDTGLNGHVKFVNRYVPLEELIRYLQASDFYITPYTDPDQTSSGTLAYSVTAGKVCISTPYAYARELLSDGRGVLVDFKSSSQIAKALNYYIEHPKAGIQMQKKSYSYGRSMIWANVALQHLNLFREIIKK